MIDRMSAIRKTFSVLTKPSTIGPTAFVGIGTAKTVKDYKDAPEHQKTQVLLMNSLMLAGSISAFTLISPLTKAFCKKGFSKCFLDASKYIVSKIFKKDIGSGKIINGTKKLLEHTEHVLKESTASTINTLAGIAGAVGANEFVQKFIFSKEPFVSYFKEKENALLQENIERLINPKNDESQKVDVISDKNETVIDTVKPADCPNNDLSAVSQETNDGTTTSKVDDGIMQNAGSSGDLNGSSKNNEFFKMNNVFEGFYSVTPKIVKDASDRVFSTMTDIPEMKLLSAPMIALTGFSVANTDGYKNKVRKTSQELLSNTFIPTIFVTAVSIAMENKKALIKYPAIFLGLLTGSYVGKAFGEKVNKYMSKKMNSSGNNIV